MAATIHQLHPESSANDPRKQATARTTRLMRALQDMAAAVIGEQLRVMFENADEVLFEMADKAGNTQEQRLYLDTMRVLRLERPRLLKSFADSLHRSFSSPDDAKAKEGGDSDNVENWSLQGSEEIEEKIAVSNMDAKAETLYSHELYDLENRLAQLAEGAGGVVTSKALAPARILGAFQNSMHGLDVEFPIKLVIYKLFDKIVVTQLGQVFSGANRLLAEHGVQPRKPARPEKRPDARKSAKSDAEISGMPGFEPGAQRHEAQALAAGMDTRQLTEAMAPFMYPSGAAAAMQGAQPAGAVTGGLTAGADMGRLMQALTPHTHPGAAARTYTNADLATEMMTALGSMAEGRPVQSWMPASNLAAVGRMFDTLYRDPRLPDAAKPLLGRLQFPIMKTSVADEGFFRDPHHPARALVNDVFEMLTGARGAAPADYKRLEQLIEHLLAQLDFDPMALSRPEKRAKPISEPEAETFIEEQRKRLESRRKHVIEKVRRIVAQELQVHMAGRHVPESTMPLILSGIAPTMAVHYLRAGHQGEDWKGTVALLDRMLASFEAMQTLPPNERAESEAAIVAEATRRLAGVGISEQRTRQLMSGLILVYLNPPPLRPPAAAVVPTPVDEAKLAAALGAGFTPTVGTPPAAPAPAPAPAALDAAAPGDSVSQRALGVILVPGSWFHVWDASQKQSRWLKLTAFHSAQNSIVFTDFSGENLMKAQADAFAQDLIAKRSEPVDPDPAVRHSLELLNPADFANAAPQTPVWVKSDRPH